MASIRLNRQGLDASIPAAADMQKEMPVEVSGAAAAVIPNEVYDFLEELTPDDVGHETIGGLEVFYEGFTKACWADQTQPVEVLEQEMLDDFKDKQAGEVLEAGWRREGYEGRPDIYYAVIKPARKTAAAPLDCGGKTCTKCGGALAPIMSAGGQMYCGCAACDTQGAPTQPTNMPQGLQQPVTAATKTASFNISDEDVLVAKTSTPMRNKVLADLDQLIKAAVYRFNFPDTEQDQAFSALLNAANRSIDAYQGDRPFLTYVTAALRNEAKREWNRVQGQRDVEIPLSEVAPDEGEGPDAEAPGATADQLMHSQQLLALVKDQLNGRDYAIVELLAMGETPWSISKEKLLKKKRYPDLSMAGILNTIKRNITPAIETALGELGERDQYLSDAMRTSSLGKKLQRYALELHYDPARTEVVEIDPAVKNVVRHTLGLMGDAEAGFMDDAAAIERSKGQAPQTKTYALPTDERKLHEVVAGLQSMYAIKSPERVKKGLAQYPIDWSKSVEDILSTILKAGDFENYAQ